MAQALRSSISIRVVRLSASGELAEPLVLQEFNQFENGEGVIRGMLARLIEKFLRFVKRLNFHSFLT